MPSSGLPRSAHVQVALIERRLRRLSARMDDLAHDAVVLGESAENDARGEVARWRSENERSSTQAVRREVRGSLRSAIDTHAPRARDLLSRAAPGLGSVDLSSEEWSTDKVVGAGLSDLVRIGAVHLGDGSVGVPLAPPLLGRSGWFIRANSSDTSADPAIARRLIQNVTLRLVSAAPPFGVRVDTYDPSLSGAMGLLGKVASAQPQIVAPESHTPDGLRSLFAELRSVSSHRASRLAQLGKARFEDLQGETATDPYRLIVLFDYPSGIDAGLQHELTLLAANGGDRGICFLVHHGVESAYDDKVDPSDLVRMLDSVRLADDYATADTIPDLWARLDPVTDSRVVAELCDAIVETTKRAELPTVDFATTLPSRERWWQRANDELTAVVGREGQEPASVRLRSGNPALPHVLIGGAVGQGKSNLLLVFVHGLAVRYSPRDLEMYLLDFKHGVEFAALGPTDHLPYWLPHLRVLGVHSDVPFGLAVLQHLVEELERRSELFKGHGNLTDIADFPAADEARPPRCLLVLDEFQILFEDEATADVAARMIEKLVRLGRAYGIHIVLSTQTVDGMQRLATRRDAIFGQVPYRIALKSTQADSQSLLRTGNTAAADLRFRGEAILNANFGAPDDNRQIIVSHADREALSRLRETLWSMDDQPRPPRIFHLSEPAELARSLGARSTTSDDGVETWTGMPISVTESPARVVLRNEPGAGIAVLGDGPTDALGVVTGLTVSAAVTAGTPSFVILDGLGSAPGVETPKHALFAVLEGLGGPVEIVPGTQVADRLASLRAAVTGQAGTTPTFVVGLGMHGIANLTARREGGVDRPIDDLQAVVRDGPAHNVFTIGWWNRLHVCTEHLGYDRCNLSTYAFLRHPLDGVRTVFGPLVRWSSEPHRVLFSDGMGGAPRVVVPFAPLTEADVEPLLDIALRGPNR